MPSQKTDSAGQCEDTRGSDPSRVTSVRDRLKTAVVLDRDFEQIEVLRDEGSRCTAFVVIHSTRLGPAFGGIRRRSYADSEAALDDAWRLARAMTFKCALAGVPGGGGKAVIIDRPGMDRGAAYRLLGSHVEMMGGRYYTGPDLGTDLADLREVASETDFVASPDDPALGHLADPTALGVCAGVEAVASRLGFTGVDGARVAVQGLGEVGWRLAVLLADRGAELVVADTREAPLERARDELGAEVLPVSEILGADCDVLAPCAVGGVLDEDVVAVLRARAVAGAANNVLASPECGAALFAAGVLVAPDFVINSGALIHGALFHLEGEAPPADRIRGIGDVVGEILDRAVRESRPPEVLAEQMARERLDAAPAGRFVPRRAQRHE